MIQSMTGFGSAEGQVNGVTYSVEIKTVNNRYFKCRIKLPEPVVFMEEEIEKVLRDDLGRGMANYVLGLKDFSVLKMYRIDEAAVKGYAEKLAAIAESVKAKCTVDIAGLLHVPGIIQPTSPDMAEVDKVRAVVLELTGKAIKALKKMRGVEGEALAADMEANCEAMKGSIEKIRARRGFVVTEYQQRLKKSVDKLLSEVNVELDTATLAREVAIFAEKADISEEISRLDSHLKQFLDSCRGDGNAGRRLDFLTQEMLREANTIGSKSSDTEITHCVVDIKCMIDRIKEQVQNVE